MAICPQCGVDMREGISCLPDPITICGDSFEPIRWGDEREAARWVIDFPCQDCGTPIGGVHHPGCCAERCPACLGQAFGCPCFGTADEDDDADEDYGEDDDDGGRHGGVGDQNDEDGDLAAHVRISTRCQAHLFHRYFRR